MVLAVTKFNTSAPGIAVPVNMAVLGAASSPTKEEQMVNRVKVDLERGTSVLESMTPEELALYSDPDQWDGDAEAAVARGAAFLDREMPGWADRVRINELQMSDACKCVLGQLFETEALSDDVSSALADGEARYNILAADSQGHPLDASLLDLTMGYCWGLVRLGLKGGPEAFFGFDHSDAISYGELYDAWVPLIEARRTKAEV